MSSTETQIPPKQQAVLDRFVAACQADDRIVAAFLGGSYARGEADQFSDLDLYLITLDGSFDDFIQQRTAFVERLGKPIFLEDFDLPNVVFFILASEVEGELGIECESRFTDIHSGPYRVLLDKRDILKGVEFHAPEPDPGKQRERLRRSIHWFWHDLSHFITAMGRGQLWWGQGQLEVLRRTCVELIRLRNDFADVDLGEEVYFKVEEALPVEQLLALQETFCPLEAEAMLQAGLDVVQFYKELAVPLADAHGLRYPEALERLMSQRLADFRRQT